MVLKLVAGSPLPYSTLSPLPGRMGWPRGHCVLPHVITRDVLHIHLIEAVSRADSRKRRAASKDQAGQTHDSTTHAPDPRTRQTSPSIFHVSHLHNFLPFSQPVRQGSETGHGHLCFSDSAILAFDDDKIGIYAVRGEQQLFAADAQHLIHATHLGDFVACSTSSLTNRNHRIKIAVVCFHKELPSRRRHRRGDAPYRCPTPPARATRRGQIITIGGQVDRLTEREAGQWQRRFTGVVDAGQLSFVVGSREIGFKIFAA